MEILNLRFYNPEHPTDIRDEPEYDWEKVVIQYELEYEDRLHAEALCIIRKDEIEEPIIAKYKYKIVSKKANILDYEGISDEPHVRITINATKVHPF